MPLGGRAVMTPHPGEAARLLSCSARDVTEALLLSAVKLQGKYGATVVCKSHCPVIAADGRTAISGAGTPALAKGGSGDTLTGIIAGLLAQLRDKPDACFEAARTACLWHGMAGRLAGRKAGVHSAMATDVIDSMGEAAAFC